MKNDKRTGSKCDEYKGQIVALLGAGKPVSQIYAELFPEPATATFTIDTLHKYTRKLKEAAQTKASDLLTQHIEKTLPNDLAMLEDLQHTAYRNSKQYHTVRAERVSEAMLAIPGKLEEWKLRILKSSDNPKKAVTWIVQECLNMLDADDRKQEMAIKHANLAISTVTTKFRTGLGEAETKGHIYINVTRPEDFHGKEQAAEDGFVPLVLKGGKDV